MGSTIYLDHAATTATDPRVLDAMLPFFGERFGNPSSRYRIGAAAQRALSEARELTADLLGADRGEVTFTGGGSESINLAVKGVAWARRQLGYGRHVLTDAIEHPATLGALTQLERAGFEITVLPVDRCGCVAVEAVRSALRPDTVLASVMYANNEVGTVQPIAEIGALCRERRVPFHVDAVQAVGALPLDVDALGADLLSLSGHKFHGPKGTGVLYVREGTLVEPLIAGAQEGGRRGGTENVPGIVGLATALEIACDGRETEAARVAALRDRLRDGITAAIPHVIVNGHPAERLPNNLHVTFEDLEGPEATESLLSMLDAEGVCVSTGSACSSRSLEPSHVLTAIGLSPAQAFSSLRMTVGRDNTAAEIDRVLELLPPLVERARAASPSYGRRDRGTAAGVSPKGTTAPGRPRRGAPR